MIPLQSLVLMLLMILAPFILYAIFFLIKCTPNPLSLLGRGGSPRGDDPGHQEAIKAGEEEQDETNNSNMEMIKADLGKETECPVCLSVFKEGEELKQIKICKHFFHQSCIDTWLSSHFNCPVCRAFVSSKKRSKGKEERENQRGRDLHRDDLWQGLPDSTGLV